VGAVPCSFLLANAPHKYQSRVNALNFWKTNTYPGILPHLCTKGARGRLLGAVGCRDPAAQSPFIRQHVHVGGSFGVNYRVLIVARVTLGIFF